MFRQATREQSRLRLTLDGPAGSGKTYTALRFAHVLADGGKIAYIDTERGSASKYVGESPDGTPWAFDVVNLQDFSPQRYIEAINAAARSGYSVLVIDSLSHAWEGKGGALEMKSNAGDSWSAWRNVTPIHNSMVDAILNAPMHVITTMRSRMEYVQEQDERGKVVIKKMGLAPIQRPGMEYEFDIVCDLDQQHILRVSKSRCSAVDGMVVEKPGPEFARAIVGWLSSGQAGKSAQYRESNPQLGATFMASAPKHTEPVWTIEKLLAQYAYEDVIKITGGSLPNTEEEIKAIVEKLSAVVDA